MADEDFRALTPLIHSHVNPYGTFELDMKKRLPLDLLTRQWRFWSHDDSLRNARFVNVARDAREESMKYAVTAASGQLGRQVMGDLLSHVPASAVVAVARTPGKLEDVARQGVAVRAGDYDDYRALCAALESVDVALLISGWDIGRRVEQHSNVVKAARTAGVGRLVYTSSMDWGVDTPIVREHQETERLLQESGLGWTILRDHLYVEPYEVEVEVAGKTGAYRTTVQGAGAAFITRGDVARCASAVLREDSHHDVVYNLTGPTATTPDDFAAVASEVSGRHVIAQDVTREQLAEDYVARGMEPDAVELSLLLEDAIRSGALSTATRDVEGILGRAGMSFHDHMLASVGQRMKEQS